MKFKHTAGPWEIKLTGNVMGDNRVIANTHGYSDNFRIDEVIIENDANARLIKTTPRLLEAVIRSKRYHYYCDDSWYSCPKHPEGCANEQDGTECNCGAEKWNNYISDIIKEATGLTLEEAEEAIK